MATAKQSSAFALSDLTDHEFATWLDEMEKKEPKEPWAFAKRWLIGFSGAEVVALAKLALEPNPSTLARCAVAVLEAHDRIAANKSASSALKLELKNLTVKEFEMSWLSDAFKRGQTTPHVVNTIEKGSEPTAPVNRRVAQINEIAAVRGRAEEAFIKRSGQLQKGRSFADRVNNAASGARPGSGSNSSASNPRPDQVDANGNQTGDFQKPNLGEGVVSPIGAASTADNGWQSIQDFFASRTPYGGRR